MELNDICPGAGWALVDVDLQPKPPFYVTRRALANVVVGMASTVTEDPTYIAIGHPPERQSLDVWAVNGTLESLDASLSIFVGMKLNPEFNSNYRWRLKITS